MIRRESLLARMAPHPTGCIIWTGYIAATGYGDFHGGPAHRAVYEEFVGPIADGLVLDHLCRTRACVNPAHLEPVTIAENNRRSNSPSALNAAKTQCVNGHALADRNLHVVASTGERRCRTCRADATRRWRERNRNANH